MIPGILLINPDYYEEIFSRSKFRAAISRGTTPLGLASIAAPLLSAGYRVKILNLNLAENADTVLDSEIREFKPEFVGITSTTPLIKKVYKIASDIKAIDDRILVIAGGPHPSALPEEVLHESSIDCVVKGEGDLTLKAIVENGLSPSVPNIYFKKDGGIIKSDVQGDFIEDLDSLPFPAYELFDIKSYRQPKISSRKEPLGYMETSRGCFGRCVFCNKNIHGYKVRMKSPERVVDEMERMLQMGFKEIQIIDDIFTANMKRAHLICEEILRRGLRFPWYPRGGIRVDRVSLDLLRIMKKAGCYRVPFGVESGSQRVIDAIRKGITLEQAENAVILAKEAGLETECYFMLGLPTETEEDIKSSIDFAIRLDPDYVKFAVTIPLPGTVMFDEMLSKGRIKTRDWEKYNFAESSSCIFDHDTLSWETIGRYYTVAHRRFYFRLNYIAKMFYKTVLNGTIFAHIKAFFRTKW